MKYVILSFLFLCIFIYTWKYAAALLILFGIYKLIRSYLENRRVVKIVHLYEERKLLAGAKEETDYKIECPYCMKKIGRRTYRCPYCGADIE